MLGIEILAENRKQFWMSLWKPSQVLLILKVLSIRVLTSPCSTLMKTVFLHYTVATGKCGDLLFNSTSRKGYVWLLSLSIVKWILGCWLLINWKKSMPSRSELKRQFKCHPHIKWWWNNILESLYRCSQIFSWWPMKRLVTTGGWGGTHGYTINLIVIRTVKNEMCFSGHKYIHRKSLFRSKALSFMPGFPLVM